MKETDVVSSAIGDFGRWQLMVGVLMGLLKLSVGWLQSGIIFLAPPQRFWCKNDAFMNSSMLNGTEINACLIKSINNESNICTEFEYDKTIFTSTIISEWNLVCSNKYYVEFTQVSFMTGLLFGFSIFGALGDKYGRRIPLITAVFLQAIASFVSSLSTSYSLFITSRFILALASGGIAVTSFVMSMEVVSGKWRTIMPILHQIPFGLGTVIVAVSSYFFRNWRHAQLMLSSLSIILVLLCWLYPESPRWLLVKNRKEEAIEMLKNISKFNKTKWNMDEISPQIKMNKSLEINENPENASIGSLFTNKKMRFKTLFLIINWFAFGIVFNGFYQHIGSVSDNIFVTVIIISLTSIPGILSSLVATRFFGRKSIMIVSEILTLICFLLILVFPKGTYTDDWPRVLFGSLAIFGMSISLPILFLFTGESFVTAVRSFGVGITSTAAKLGSVVSPLVLYLDRIDNNLPLVVLSALMILIIITLLPLPETKLNRSNVVI